MCVIFLFISGSELVVVLVAAWLLLGTRRLPETARFLGKSLREIKKATAEFKQEIERLKNDPELKPWEKVSAAIGIAHFLPGQDKTVEEVFKRSDKAMYEDKIAMKAQRTD